MKHKPLFLFALTPLVIASCGKTGYVGKYSFQLGKNSGAHAAVAMTLTNDDYIYEGKTLGKKMTILGDVRMGPPQDSSGSASSSPSSSVTPASSSVAPAASSSPAAESSQGDDMNLDALAGIFEIPEGVVEIPGYYTVAEKLQNGRNHFKFGIDFTEWGEVGEILEALGYEIIEQFVYSEIDTRKIYLQIPVSFSDLAYQLYWYGFDFPFLFTLDNIAKRPSGIDSMASSSSQAASSESAEISSESEEPELPAHAPGTKPTSEDIAKINETYPATHDGRLYRIFYTINLSLTRQ